MDLMYVFDWLKTLRKPTVFVLAVALRGIFSTQLTPTAQQTMRCGYAVSRSNWRMLRQGTAFFCNLQDPKTFAEDHKESFNPLKSLFSRITFHFKRSISARDMNITVFYVCRTKEEYDCELNDNVSEYSITGIHCNG